MKRFRTVLSIFLALFLSACSTDKTPPVVQILTGPSEVVNRSTGFSLKVSDNVSNSDLIEVRTRFSRSGEWSDWSNELSQTFDRFQDGKHILEVQARDEAGNESQPVPMEFEVVSIPCYLDGVTDPITGYTLTVQTVEMWDGSPKKFGDTTIQVFAGGKLAHAPAHNTGWILPGGNGYGLVAIASKEALPGSTVGILYVLGCDGKNYLLFTERDKQIGLRTIPQEGIKMRPIP